MNLRTIHRPMFRTNCVAELAVAVLAALAAVGWSGTARAADSASVGTEEPSPPSTVKTEIPILAYTYQAAGASAQTLGVQVYGAGTGAGGRVGLNGSKPAILGGGMTFWGSPIDRLTLVGDASRDQAANFAPSAAAIVRLLGRPGDGLSLGAISKFKVEGFGVGPKNEMENEIEGGFLLSYAKHAWHLDANAITGFGTGDDGEIDTEGRLRLGRDLGDVVRIGIDGQMRYRVNGATKLVGNRVADFTGGPQVVIAGHHVYGALTAGPSTVNVFGGIGWTAVATVGGSTL